MVSVLRKFPQSQVVLLAYQGVLAATVAGFVTLLALTHHGVGNLWTTTALALVSALAERARVRIGNLVEISISLVPTVFVAALFGPVSAIIVGAASYAGRLPILYSHEGRRTATWARWWVYTCSRGISGGLAGVAATVVGRSFEGNITAVVAATVSATLVAEVADIGLYAATISIRGHSPRGPLRLLAPIATMTVVLYAPLIAMLAVAYRDLTPWLVAFFFVPALAAQRLFALYQSQRQLSDGLATLNATLEQANLSFASALVATLDARDRYTAGHSAAVAIYARDIAARLQLPERDQRLAHLCGLVHDIGKIGLPAGLLEKPGALTLDERREMQRHSTIGERILSNVETYNEIADVVRHHHERLDGHGYPDGIAGDEIPLLARIIAVADAYNAMTSDRPYRDAMPTRVARLRLAQAADSQFDTDVVGAFEAVLATASEEYLKAKGPEFLWLHDLRAEPLGAPGELRIAN